MSKTISCALLAVILIAGGTSCRKNLSDGLEVGLPSKSYRISNTEDYSCGGNTSNPPDIQASHINFRKLEVKWRGEKDLVLEGVRIVLNSSDLSGGVFEKEITGSDFDILVGSVSSTRIVSPGEVLKMSCDMKIGGISLNDPKRSAFGSGYVRLLGATPDGDVDTAVGNEAYFSFEFNPN